MLEVKFKSKFIQPIVIALGFFDCVHEGHISLISEALRLSKELNSLPAAMTFTDSQNYSDITGKKAIYSYYDRAERMNEESVKVLIYADFEEKFRNLSAKKFLKIMNDSLYITGIVVGKDFSYGKKAQGNIASLAKFCKRKKIVLSVAEDFTDGIRVSSSAIRELLSSGDLDRANKLLGSYYRQSGKVQKGQGLGRKIGIGTANLAVPDNLVRLKEGVYATLCKVDGKIYSSVTNLGAQPTVGGETFRSETHIFGLEEDLYGKNLTVYYLKRLRDLVKFDSVEEMRVQIQKDIALAKQQTAQP